MLGVISYCVKMFGVVGPWRNIHILLEMEEFVTAGLFST